MWYGNPSVAPVTGNPEFDFIASVDNETKPEKRAKKLARKS
jgi:hypothetical protein